MFLSILIGVLCVALVVIYSYVKKTYRIVSETNLPRSSSFLLIGSWFGIWRKVIGDEDIKNVEQYGKLYWSFDGTNPNLFVANPDLVQIILLSKADDFESYRGSNVSNDILKKSLKVIERKNEKTKEIFDQKNMKKLIPRVERSAESLVQELQKKDGNICIQQPLMQYIGDVIAMAIFGIDLYSDEYKDLRPKFMENVNRVFRVSNPTSVIYFMPYAYPDLESMDKMILPPEAVTFFSELCVSVLEKKKALSDTTEISSKGIDVMDLLIKKLIPKEKRSEEVIGHVEEKLPDAEEIIAECLSIILYTVRSTEATLSAAMYVLSNSDEEQGNLHNEVVKINYPSGEKCYGQPCLEAQYLEMFLKEIQRLYPIEYRLTRNTTKEIELGQVTLPANISVTVPVYAMHHLPEFFPEPMDFKPERFAEERNKTIKDMTYFPTGQAASNSSFVGFHLYNLFSKIGLTYMFMNFKILPPTTQFQAPITFAKGATEVPVLMPVVVQLEKRS